MQTPGCAIAPGGNITWANASSQLYVPAPLSYAACPSGIVLQLTLARLGDSSETANCTLSVNISQVAFPPAISDCGPRTIAERQLAGTPAGPALTASVPNVGTAIIWSINASKSAGGTLPFSIGPCDGVLRATTALRFRDHSNYTIAVTATNDGRSMGIGAAASYCIAQVAVIAVPQPPTLCAFVKYPCEVPLSLPDFSVAGTPIGSLGSLAADMDGYPIVSFVLVPGSGAGASFFNVSFAQGNITLIAPLDAASNGVYTLPAIVNVSSSHAWGLHTVVLTVLAMPRPPAIGSQLCSVAELVPAGTLLRCPPNAASPGLPLTAASAYNLSWSLPNGGLGLFSISPGGVLRVATGGAALAYSASTSGYSLIVMASDTNGNFASAPVTVTLLEVSKPPTWGAGGIWNFSIPDGAPGGTATAGPLAVSATPGKSGSGLIFSLVAVVPPPPLPGGAPLWAVAPTTGAITLFPGAPLAFDRNASFPLGLPFTYTLLLSALDVYFNTTPAALGVAYVTVTSIPPLAFPGGAVVPANASAGAFVATLRATTVYPSGRLLFSISAQDTTVEGDPVLAINATSGALSVANNSYTLAGGGVRYGPPRWNPNTRSAFSVAWSVLDTATGRTASATFTLQLSLVNRAPAWNTSALAAYMVAQWGAGATAFRTFAQTTTSAVGVPLSLFATDPDLAPSLGVPEALMFSIAAGNADGVFAISPNSGQLSVASATSPAFAYPGSFALTIVVTDVGVNGPPLSASLALTIALDPSQVLPSLAGGVFTVAEHAPAGTVVGSLTATSPAGAATSFSYSLAWAGANVNQPFPFAISTVAGGGPGSGVIVVLYAQALGALAYQGPLAFSGQFRSYAATVTVAETRPGVPSPLFTSAALIINVTWVAGPPYWDPAIVPPVYAPMPGFTLAGVLKERGGAGTNASSGAVDAAAPFSARIKDPFLVPFLFYSLVPPAHPVLAIDAGTGRVFVRAGAVPVIAAATPTLTAVLCTTVVGAPAPFAAANGLNATAPLALTVLEVNTVASFAPPLGGLFPGPAGSPGNSTTSLTLLESTTAATGVFARLVAVDANPSTSLWGLKRYWLTGAGSDRFVVDATSGALSVAPGVALDFYDKPLFSLVGWESDLDPGANLSTSLAFTISLTQVNTVTVTGVAPTASSLSSGVAVLVAGSPYAVAFPTHVALLSSSVGAVVDVNGTGFGPRAGVPAPTITARLGAGAAGACTVVTPNTIIRCTLPAGTGVGYPLTVTVNGAWSASAPPSQLLGYIPPTVTGIAVEGLPGGAQLLPTSGAGATLVVTGANLGPPGGTSGVLLLGPAGGNPSAFSAAPCTTRSTATAVACPAPAGFGGNLSFTLVLGGSPSPPFVSPMVAYAPPALAAVATGGLLDTMGGGAITVTGANLGPAGTAAPDVALTFGGLFGVFSATRCVVTVAHNVLSCIAPPGVGAGQPATVWVGGQPSPPLPGANGSVSYAPPTITGLRGAGAAAVPTPGGVQIEVVGTQFGPPTPIDASSGLPMAGAITPTAIYGRRGVANFSATDCIVTVAGTVMQCLLGPGTGAGLSWRVAVGGQLSPPSAQTTAYLPPVVFYFSGDGAHLGATPGAQNVTIFGTNFGPLGSPLRAAYGVNVTGGKDFVAVGCAVTAAHTAITCATAPGAGATLSWTVTVDEQDSVVAFTDYAPPSVDALEGPGAQDGDPNGGQLVVVRGTNFGAPQWFERATYGPTGYEYAAINCSLATPHETLFCFTAPGCGAALRWVVRVRGQSSLPSAATTSYATPSILGVWPPVLPQFFDAAKPVLLTLITKNLPLRTPSYAIMVQFGNGPDWLSPPYLRNLLPFVPTIDSSIRAATNVDGSVNITVALPPVAWTGAPPPPLATTLWADPWSLAQPPPYGMVPGGAGGQVGLRLLVLPAAGASLANASVATVAAVLGSFSVPQAGVSTVGFTGPSISSVTLTRPPWTQPPSSPNATAPACPLTGVAWSCFDPAVMQLTIAGEGFAAWAPGVLRELAYCDDAAANCSKSGSGWDATAPVSPPPPQGSGPTGAVGAPLWVATWDNRLITAFSTRAMGSVRVRLTSWGVAPPVSGLPAPTWVQEAVQSFKDLSPSITAIRGAAAPFPTVGDPARVVAIDVDQLAGATSVNVTVGGAPAMLCNAGGVLLATPADFKAVVLDAGGPLLWTIYFTVPAGQGRGMPVVVVRTRGTDAPALSNGAVTVDYIQPMLAAASVDGARLTGGDGAFRDYSLGGVGVVVNVSTDGTEVVTLRGTNLGVAPVAVFSPTSSPALAPPFFVPTAACVGVFDHSCVTFAMPQGQGGRWAMGLNAGNQAAAPVAWAFSPPVVTALTQVGAPDSALPPGFPTEGGVTVLLTGRNFGPPAAPGPFSVTFGLTSFPQASWASCTSINRISHYAVSCVLPPGSGASLTMAVLVGDVVGFTPGVFSYGAPVVTGWASSAGITPADASSGWLFPVARGPTVGGALLTVTGYNFGALDPAAHCAFLTWAQRPPDAAPPPAPQRTHTCNGGEDWLGEGEIDASLVVAWGHRSVTFRAPEGLGEKELQLNVRGGLLQPPRRGGGGANVTAAPGVPRFRYSDPVVFSATLASSTTGALLGAPPPQELLVNTEGGDVIVLNGTNFGPSVFNISGVNGPLGGDFFNPPLPLLCGGAGGASAASALPCAPSLETAYPVVHFHRACVAYGFTPSGLPAPPSTFTVRTISAGQVPLLSNTGAPSCTAGLLSVSHNRLIFYSAPGVGTARNLTVSIVSATGREQVFSPPFIFSYMPPQITRFDPRVVLLQGVMPVNMWGKNFGNVELAVAQAWSAEELIVGAWTGGVPCASVQRSRVDGATVITCTIDTSRSLVGYNNASVLVAGQVGSVPAAPQSSALLLACDAGYYGRPNETCLRCPAIDFDRPALSGATCPGYLYSLPNENDRFPYPRPNPGWFNLNSSDRFTAAGGLGSMLSACPAAMAVPGRDVCIVPCEPPDACVGNNFCAEGYASLPPMFRCSSCAKGYFKSVGQCIKCPDSPAALLVGMFLLLVVVAMGGFYLNKKQVNIAVVSIGIDFFQVIAIFATAGVKWPAPVMQLYRILSAFNLNIEIVAPECLLPNVSYQQKFAFIMMLPLGVFSLLLLAYLGVAFHKRCIKGQRDRRKVFSHRPAIVSSTLVLLYLLYLYITRTVLDVFDCTPTSPPDGFTYLKVVFERCGVPGGTQLTLLPAALAGLGAYTLGYPAYIARALWRNRELIMEDQLLRAKGVGNDLLTNPHAFDLRRTLGRSYFQFKPRFFAWILVIVARKFAIAVVAVMFSKSVGFQMASCLLIMFVAYSLQVQVRPYMAPDDFAVVVKDHETAAAAGDALACRLAAQIKGIESRGRKRAPPRALLTPSGRIDRAALLTVVGSVAFNYNTVEAVMSCCAVIVCLAGLMYQAELAKSTGLSGTIDAITGLLLFTISVAIVYFSAALGNEIYQGVVEARARRARGKSKGGFMLSSSVGGAPGEAGNLDTSVNPMFLSKGGELNIGGDLDALVKQILAQTESPPTQLWTVFRDEFAATVARLQETKAKCARQEEELQKVEALRELTRMEKGKSVVRREFEPRAKELPPLDEDGGGSGGAKSSRRLGGLAKTKVPLLSEAGGAAAAASGGADDAPALYTNPLQSTRADEHST
jgi:hypothetical protein